MSENFLEEPLIHKAWPVLLRTMHNPQPTTHPPVPIGQFHLHNAFPYTQSAPQEE